jgi:Ca-activated chloride channel homolog
MNEQSDNHNITPELEARIVALVLGEVSDPARELLNEMIQQQPALAAVKAEFEAVHAVMCDVGAGDDDLTVGDDWQLPAEKRSALLSVIEVATGEPPTIPLVSTPVQSPMLLTNRFTWSFSNIAAVFCVVGFFGWLMMTQVGRPSSPLTVTFSVDAAPNPLAASDSGAEDFAETTESLQESSSPSSSVPEPSALYRKAAEQNDAYLNWADGDPSEMDAKSDWKKEGDVGLGMWFDTKSNEYFQLPQGQPAGIKADESTPALSVSAAEDSDGEAFFGDHFAEGMGAMGGGDDSPVASRGAALFGPAGAVDERWREAQPASKPAGEPAHAPDGGGGQQAGINRYTDLPSAPDTEFESRDQIEKSQGMVEELSESETLQGGDGLPADKTYIAGEDSQIQAWSVTDLAKNEEFERGADEFAMGRGVRDGVLDGRQPLSDFEEQKQLDGLEKGKALLGTRTDTKLNNGDASGAELGALVTGRRSRVAQSDKFLQPADAAGVLPSGLNELSAAKNAFSTFSLHVSDVSFKLAESALARGEWPEAAKIRIEEFVNAFDYGDPLPCHDERIACYVEQSIHPFLQQRNVLRVSMRTAAAGRASSTPLRLTFLLDNSGSMERIDRQDTVRRAFALLAAQLKPIDQVTLISFARQPRLLADQISGEAAQQLVELIDQLPSEGGTNIEAALQLAFEKAKEQQLSGAQNRIVLLTDGAVNLGDAQPESLSRMIETIRDAGIAFDAAGISAEGLNDEVLEALTRKGDGRYYLLDSAESADDGFARQIAGALRPSAKNVKVQVEFNPKRVGQYKLLGFEKHLLKQEDFRNDQVDAAEMAAAEAGVAVYQFEAKPNGEGDVGSVSVRFRDLATGQMVEHRWPIPYEADPPRPDQANASLRIATTAAMFAAKLRGEPLGETVDLKTLSDLLSSLPEREHNAQRVQQLQRMIQQARELTGN